MNTSYLYNVNSEYKLLQIYYYENLRDKINSIIYYLDKSIKYMENLDNSYQKYFHIDEFSSSEFYKIKNEILSRVNYLNYTIMPAIKQKIDSLK